MKIFQFCSICLFLIIYSQKGYSQWNLDNQFRFKDGIYLSSADYFSNTPSIEFKQDQVPKARYGKFNESQFKDYQFKIENGGYKNLDIKDVWGISVKGVAYIFSGFSVANETDISILTNTIKKSRNLIFSEIIYVGNISLFSYKRECWMIKPDLQKPARLTVKNIKEVIKDDAELYSQYNYEKRKRKNKHSFLVQYNKRNPIVVNQLAQRD
jgi:hypothetical protein